MDETTIILFVPVSRSKYTLVKCASCNTVLKSKTPLDRLVECSADDIELKGLLRPRGDMVRGFFAVSSIIFSVGPVFGPLWAVLSILLNRKSPAWMRITAKIGLALSIFWNLLFLYRITAGG